MQLKKHGSNVNNVKINTEKTQYRLIRFNLNRYCNVGSKTNGHHILGLKVFFSLLAMKISTNISGGQLNYFNLKHNLMCI